MKRFVVVGFALLTACGGGGGSGGGTPPVVQTPTPAPAPGTPSLANVERISTDPFTNGTSQHATEVEPAAASNANTIVAAFQTGRFFTHGASDIGFATSFDGGTSWQSGTIPGTTHYTILPGPYDAISDPAVAHDVLHGTWIIAALPVMFDMSVVPGVVVSTSVDGLTWSTPIGVTPVNETTNDKSWVACDDHTGSPFYGRCYVEWDSFAGNGTIFMSTSSDGGHTWTAPKSPPSSIGGIGGQPVVQPDGTVIVPIDDIFAQNVLAFRSRDGGTTWSAPVKVASIADHLSAGNIRGLPLVSGAADGAGNVYVVWHDCRFRTSCTANDLVMTTSADGIAWTAVTRIPIDTLTSTADHFIPGLGIQPGTSGAGAHLGVTYYSYANTACTVTTCQLSANFIASQDGGASWGVPQVLAGPMLLSSLAQTQDGAMVGDYMATTFAGTHPVGFAAVANPLMGSIFDEGMYVPRPGIVSTQSLIRRTSFGEHPVPGFHSDHPPRRIHP